MRIGTNREFVRDLKGSSCGSFENTVAMCPGKLRENFMLVRSLPVVASFVDCPGVFCGSA
jgi:hypothetical protein